VSDPTNLTNSRCGLRRRTARTSYNAFIDELYIVPEYRRRGFGLRAVELLEAEANKLGVNAVHLEVDDGNAAAFELYGKMRFDDHNRFLMTKWLQHPQ
jgi:ribosomal protein S18 acetylase RimI-like enzyme